MIHSYPWYVSDWRSSETRIKLSPAERCLYRELLDYCWLEGSIPKEESLLASISAFDLKEFRKCWNAVQPLFVEHEGRLSHHRVIGGRDALQSWQESRRSGGRKGGLAQAIARGKAVAIAQAKPQAIAQCTGKLDLKPSTSTSTSTSVEAPLTPLPISPTEAEPGYWVERFMEIHPSPCDPRFPWVFCEDNFHRLGEDPVKFTAFMAEVHRGLISWAGHWAIDGNRFAKPLERWLTAGGWKKAPPLAIQAASRPGRFELLEDDDEAK